MGNELQKDYLLDRWVVIATQRKRRPTDFVKNREEEKGAVCPFCPGTEHMTPPAVLIYISSSGRIIKEQDRNGRHHQNWLVRCVPNLYPIFSPLEGGKIKIEDGSLKNALGHHEMLIESPQHDEHPAVARVSQLTHVIDSYVDRGRSLSAMRYVKYVSVFRNHGPEAGASLSHAHSQIIATPFVPRV